MATDFSVNVKFTAIDDMTKTLDKLNNMLNQFQQNIMNVNSAFANITKDSAFEKIKKDADKLKESIEGIASKTKQSSDDADKSAKTQQEIFKNRANDLKKEFELRQAQFKLDGDIGALELNKYKYLSSMLKLRQQEVSSLGDTKERQTQILKLQLDIKKLNESSQQKSMDDLNKSAAKASESLGNVSSNFKNINNTMGQSSASINNVGKSINNMSQGATQSSQNIGKLNASIGHHFGNTSIYKNITDVSHAIGTELGKGSLSSALALKSMADASGQSVSALQVLSGAAQEVGRRLVVAFADASKQLLGFIANMSVDFVKDSVSAAGNFEVKLVQLKNTMGATDEQMAKLRASAIELGKSTKFSADEVVVAQTALASLGAGDNVIELQEDVLNLAAAGLDLDKSARTVMGTVSSFDLTVGDSTHVVDLMARSTQLSGFQLGEFQKAYAKAGASAVATGQSIEDTTAIMMTLRNAGVSASKTGGDVSRLFERMAVQTDGASKALDELGVSFYDSDGNMKNAFDNLTDLNSALEGYTEEQQNAYLKTILGTQGFRTYSTVMASSTRDANGELLRGVDVLKYYSNELENANGVAEEFRLGFEATFEGQVEILKGLVSTAQIEVGEYLLPSLTDAVKMLQEMINGIDFQKIGVFLEEGLNAFMALFDVIAQIVNDTLVPTFNAIIPVITNVFIGVSGVFEKLSAMIEPFINSLATMMEGFSPVLEKVFDFVGTLIEIVTPFVNTLIEQLAPVMNMIFDIVGRVFVELSKIFDQVLRPIMDVAVQIVNKIMPQIEKTLQNVFKLLEPVFEIISIAIDNIMAILNPILDIFFEIFDVVTDVGFAFSDMVFNLLGPILEGIKVVFGTISEVLRSVIGGAMDFFKSIAAGFQEHFKPVIDFFNWIGQGAAAISNTITNMSDQAAENNRKQVDASKVELESMLVKFKDSAVMTAVFSAELDKVNAKIEQMNKEAMAYSLLEEKERLLKEFDEFNAEVEIKQMEAYQKTLEWMVKSYDALGFLTDAFKSELDKVNKSLDEAKGKGTEAWGFDEQIKKLNTALHNQNELIKMGKGTTADKLKIEKDLMKVQESKYKHLIGELNKEFKLQEATLKLQGNDEGIFKNKIKFLTDMIQLRTDEMNVLGKTKERQTEILKLQLELKNLTEDTEKSEMLNVKVGLDFEVGDSVESQVPESVDVKVNLQVKLDELKSDVLGKIQGQIDDVIKQRDKVQEDMMKTAEDMGKEAAKFHKDTMKKLEDVIKTEEAIKEQRAKIYENWQKMVLKATEDVSKAEEQLHKYREEWYQKQADRILDINNKIQQEMEKITDDMMKPGAILRSEFLDAFGGEFSLKHFKDQIFSEFQDVDSKVSDSIRLLTKVYPEDITKIYSMMEEEVSRARHKFFKKYLTDEEMYIFADAASRMAEIQRRYPEIAEQLDTELMDVTTKTQLEFLEKQVSKVTIVDDSKIIELNKAKEDTIALSIEEDKKYQDLKGSLDKYNKELKKVDSKQFLNQMIDQDKTLGDLNNKYRVLTSELSFLNVQFGSGNIQDYAKALDSFISQQIDATNLSKNREALERFMSAFSSEKSQGVDNFSNTIEKLDSHFTSLSGEKGNLEDTISKLESVYKLVSEGNVEAAMQLIMLQTGEMWDKTKGFLEDYIKKVKELKDEASGVKIKDIGLDIVDEVKKGAPEIAAPIATGFAGGIEGKDIKNRIGVALVEGFIDSGTVEKLKPTGSNIMGGMANNKAAAESVGGPIATGFGASLGESDNRRDVGMSLIEGWTDYSNVKNPTVGLDPNAKAIATLDTKSVSLDTNTVTLDLGDMKKLETYKAHIARYSALIIEEGQKPNPDITKLSNWGSSIERYTNLIAALRDGGYINNNAGHPLAPNSYDNQLIWAHPGEYVIRESSAQSLGSSVLEYLNENGRLPKVDLNISENKVAKKKKLKLSKSDNKSGESKSMNYNTTIKVDGSSKNYDSRLLRKAVSQILAKELRGIK